MSFLRSYVLPAVVFAFSRSFLGFPLTQLKPGNSVCLCKFNPSGLCAECLVEMPGLKEQNYPKYKCFLTDGFHFITLFINTHRLSEIQELSLWGS